MPQTHGPLAPLIAAARRTSRPAARILLALLLVVSLLLCLATTAVWVRSHWRWDRWCWYDRVARTARPRWPDAYGPRPGTGYALTVDAGSISLTRTTSWPAARLHVEAWHTTGPSPFNQWHPVRTLWNRLGFYDFWFGNAGGAFADEWRTVGVPLWLPALATAAPPAAWLLRRRRRVPSGHCSRCGYDLRATPELCPECGAAAGTASR
jgi:hypothetical protein